MLAQFPQAHTEVVTSLTFSPHVSHVLCSTSGDDSAALWDVQGAVNIAHLRGHHRGPVNHALFLPNDPNALLTASDDRTIALWDTRRVDKPVAQLSGFHDGVNKMLLLSSSWFPNCGLPATGREDDYLVASACDDGRVYVHALVPLLLSNTGSNSVAPPDPLSPSSPPGAAATASSGSGSGGGGAPAVASTLTSSTLPSAGALVDCFWASTSTVNDLVLSANRQTILTASEDGAVRSWRLMFDPVASTEDRLLCSLDEFENPVNHIALVPQGLMMEGGPRAAGSPTSAGEQPPPSSLQPFTRQGNDDEDDNVGARDADAADDEPGAGGAPADCDATSAAVSRPGVETFIGNDAEGDSGQAELARRQREEEMRTGLRRWVLAACSEFVFGVDLNITTSEFGQGARSFVGHGDYVRGLEFTKAGTLLTVSDDSTAMEWDLNSGEPIRQVKLHEGFVMASALNGAGDALATGTDRGEIRIWRLPFQTERLGGQ